MFIANEKGDSKKGNKIAARKKHWHISFIITLSIKH